MGPTGDPCLGYKQGACQVLFFLFYRVESLFFLIFLPNLWSKMGIGSPDEQK
jgi:hypothetical protein